MIFFSSSLFRAFWWLFLILASISYHSLIPIMLPPLSLAHTQIGQGEPVCAKLKEELVWLCTNLLSTLRVARCYQQVQAYSSLQSLCTFCTGELDNQLKTQCPMGPGLPGFKLHSLFHLHNLRLCKPPLCFSFHIYGTHMATSNFQACCKSWMKFLPQVYTWYTSLWI